MDLKLKYNPGAALDIVPKGDLCSLTRRKVMRGLEFEPRSGRARKTQCVVACGGPA